jgi:hypothetical protein
MSTVCSTTPVVPLTETVEAHVAAMFLETAFSADTALAQVMAMLCVVVLARDMVTVEAHVAAIFFSACFVRLVVVFKKRRGAAAVTRLNFGGGGGVMINPDGVDAHLAHQLKVAHRGFVHVLEVVLVDVQVSVVRGIDFSVAVVVGDHPVAARGDVRVFAAFGGGVGHAFNKGRHAVDFQKPGAVFLGHFNMIAGKGQGIGEQKGEKDNHGGHEFSHGSILSLRGLRRL